MKLNIGFWKKESGNIMSHGKGLNSEQIEALKGLKEGDRFIIYLNTRKGENTPEYTLQIYSKPPLDTL